MTAGTTGPPHARQQLAERPSTPRLFGERRQDPELLLGQRERCRARSAGTPGLGQTLLMFPESGHDEAGQWIAPER